MKAAVAGPAAAAGAGVRGEATGSSSGVNRSSCCRAIVDEWYITPRAPDESFATRSGSRLMQSAPTGSISPIGHKLLPGGKLPQPAECLGTRSELRPRRGRYTAPTSSDRGGPNRWLATWVGHKDVAIQGFRATRSFRATRLACPLPTVGESQRHVEGTTSDHVWPERTAGPLLPRHRD